MGALSSVFLNENNAKVIINSHDNKLILLKEPSKQELNMVKKDFEALFFDLYIDKLKNPDKRQYKAHNKTENILAFSASTSSKDSDILTNFRRIDTGLIKEFLGYNSSSATPFSGSGINKITIDDLYQKHIVSLSIEEQKELFDTLFKTYGKKLIKFPTARDEYPSRFINQVLEVIEQVGLENFLNSIFDLIEYGSNNFDSFIDLYFSTHKKHNITIPSLRVMLSITGILFQKYELALFPFKWISRLWVNAYNLDLLEAAQRSMTPSIQKVLINYPCDETNLKGQGKNLYYAPVIGLFLCSNIKDLNEYTPMLNFALQNTSYRLTETIKKSLIKLKELKLEEHNNQQWKNYIPMSSEISYLKNQLNTELLLSSTFINENGKKIEFNGHTNRVIVINEPHSETLDKISIEAKQYFINYYLTELRNIDKRTKSKKPNKNEHTIRAFSTHKVKGMHNRMTKISSSCLKEYFGYSTIAPNYSATNSISVNDLFTKYILPLSIEKQQLLYDDLLKIYGKSIISPENNSDYFVFQCIDYIVDLIRLYDVGYVFNSAMYLYDKSSFFQNYLKIIAPGLSTSSNASVQHLLRAYAFIGMMLHEYNSLLLPFIWIKDMWNGNDLLSATTSAMPSSKDILLRYKKLDTQISRSAVNEEFDSLVGLCLCSNLNTLLDYTPMFKYSIFNIISSTKRYAYITTVKTHLNRVQRFVTANSGVTEWIDYQPNRTSKDFIYLDKAYKEHPHLVEWIKLANIYISEEVVESIKTIDIFERSINTWIKFLSGLTNPPLKPMDTSREMHIKDRSKPRSNKHYYFYIGNQEHVSNKYKNDTLRVVESFFVYIRNHFSPDLPVLLVKSDKFFMGTQRHKTARKRLPSSLLAIAKILITEDLEYIKKYNGSYEMMFNNVTKEYGKVWWPGYRCLITTLLLLPLRNKQARWLDSGELDEYIIDYENMKYVKNPSPYSIKGRKACALQLSIDQVTGEQHFMIYVSTNKTGAPYTIPYAPQEFIDAFREMKEFNSKWAYQMQFPIRAVDRGGKEANKTSKLYPEICPIFRLPTTGLDDPFAAISGERLMKFYVYLLEGIENLAKRENRNIKLIDRSNPSYKKAIFDIHALRVTGISELIEAGVPVDVVSEFVAGHANSIMTLYYNVMKHSKVKESLEQARDRIAVQGSISELFDYIEANLIVAETYGDKEQAFKLLLERKDSNLIEIGLDGICPGADCSDYGREDRCCPKCPVWITGPAFLVGQTAKINQLIYLIRNKAQEIAACRKERIMENNELRKQHLTSNEEMLHNEFGALITEWGTRHHFIQISLARLNNDNGNKMTLVSKDSNIPTIKLEESDELGILNHVCQAGAIFNEVSIPEAQYDLEYMLNQLLKKNGLFPYLVMLDKETAKESSLLLIDQLLSKYNSSQLLELIKGDKLLNKEEIDDITLMIESNNNLSLPIQLEPKEITNDSF